MGALCQGRPAATGQRGCILTLAAFFSQAQAVVPALQGRCGQHVGGLPAGPAAEQLLAAMQRQHPRAGRAFWALRTYARLVWQPAYASVMAVEWAGRVLPLAGLRWQLDIAAADVDGFTLPAAAWMTPTPADTRPQAADQVQAMAARLLAAVQAGLPLHPKAARRLLADCVLSALLRAQPRMGCSDDRLRAAGSAWLALLGAGGDSGYLEVCNAAGRPRLVLDRGICCLDDRREGGELCNTCPRLARGERLQRLQALAAGSPA